MPTLSDITIRKAVQQDKPVKLNDGAGLYLVVTPTGGKLWRFNYRFMGKQKTLSIGKYPTITLSKARERHQAALVMLADGIDPAAAKQQKKTADKVRHDNTLASMVDAWLGRQACSAATISRKRKAITADLFPALGKRPITDIEAPQLLAELRKVEARGANYSAHRLREYCGEIWRFAVAEGHMRADQNIVPNLKGALKPFEVTNHPAITDPARLGDLLRAIENYTGSPVTVAALKLAPMLLCRPGELRNARWADVDLVAGKWCYLASKTKQSHIVPLSKKAIAIFTDLRNITGHSDLVFPGVRNHAKPMSENTINAALRYLGFEADEVVGHGFRATARTLLDEVLGFRLDFIEHQLAHAVKDPLGTAYNRTTHLAERTKMMQAWADYLDRLRIGADVVALRPTKPISRPQ
ncbi:MAG: integrase arm-type DNA-binding domain-containing protein [Sulfurimicrobium sp.]|nr:integrase arm-type DNA-binding domain-containing protein [Sulfurimicrobium sp.]